MSEVKLPPLSVERFIREFQEHGYALVNRTKDVLDFENEWGKRRVIPINIIKELGWTIIYDLE